MSDVLFPRPSLAERSNLVRILSRETLGGGLMLGAAVIAMIWANSPLADSYDSFRAITFGPEALQLNIDLKHWIQDGLLAIFFAVAGLELRREFSHGDLRNPKNAVLPIAAALGGMVVPAAFYLAFTWDDVQARAGWAIPMATDIAFSLAVLAVVGRHLPSALRAFLLTLAIVDDLVAILVIALFFSDKLALVPLLASAIFLTIYGLSQRAGWTAWYVAIPLALAAWVSLHSSGVHATVAGVAIGVMTSNQRRRGSTRSAEERYEEILRPISAGVAVPLFALVSAGVEIKSGFFSGLINDGAAMGVVTGLVLGKIIGITGCAYLITLFSKAELNPELNWSDVFGVSCVAGIGFTVSLLIASLAFGTADGRTDNVIAAVLVGSLIASVMSALVLAKRNRYYRSIAD
jgi:Na+:H+ antiporter, NhaA family